MTLTIGVAVSLFKELKDLEQGRRMRVWMLAHSLYRSCKRRSVNAGITVYSQTQRASWYGHPDSAGALSTLCATDPAFWRTRASCPAINAAQ